MNGLDIALVVIMSYFFLHGIFRGLVKEVVGIVGLVVAFIAANTYWPLGAEHLAPLTESPSYRAAMSFLIIFMVVYFLVGLIGIFADKIVKLTMTPLVSSLLGAVIGVAKGALFCCVVLMLVLVFIKKDSSFFAESIAWPHAEPLVERVREWVPEKFRELLEMKRPTLTGERKAGAPSGSAKPVTSGTLDVDWKAIQTVLQNKPELISPAWRDKLRAMTGPEAISSDDIKKFIHENPTVVEYIKSIAGRPPAADVPAAPKWAQPAD